MIPAGHIEDWRKAVPWREGAKVEQDLIICRALVVIFSNEILSKELRIRGGTALNKLHFPEPFRYSEDIDLVCTVAPSDGTFASELRDVLEPWLGMAKFVPSTIAPKMVFRVKAAEDVGKPIKLKVEINTSERVAFDPTCKLRLAVDNPWFSGEASIPTFSREEMLATKLRAMLGRDKRRDLFDVDHALRVFEGLDVRHVVDLFFKYEDKHGSGKRMTKAKAQKDFSAKYKFRERDNDVRDMLAPKYASVLSDEGRNSAFLNILENVVELLPGKPWAGIDKLTETLESGP